MKGPNWIHGTDDNPILDLAKETKTVLMNWDGRQSVFDSLGNPMPDEEAAKNTEHVWSIIEQAMKFSNEHSASIPADKSLYNFFEEQVGKMFPADDGKEEEEEDAETQKKKQQTILQMAEMWGAFVGSPIQTQSLKFFWLEECIDGENLFVASTYAKVLAKIAEPALKGAEILFRHTVNKIIADENSSSVTIELDNNRPSMVFDEVVMTAPLGWLKRNPAAFEPPLPPRLQQAIQSLGYGHLDKVYFTFPTAFWDVPTTSSTTPTSSTSTPPASSSTTPQPNRELPPYGRAGDRVGER
ncbi:amine oxidase [Pyrenophora seminiperda CCB06]|uniref:Amine oxidase n=1 Tax=Pyrenophora seminiperda CCB06 TaxID=1302712 RepID=A0A3M7M860_9PLEO|nr:amine oxidase [Pyrenophora seminiperda CCB06]